ncbi:MAG: coenzyme F420-0:L-glutamate ligase [archaeon]|nr:coenzyme F420-0:L-glutamate ligase [archaeon]MCP8306854.1 coenzyme F420-0:L-glutamate ligase [archaeon]
MVKKMASTMYIPIHVSAKRGRFDLFRTILDEIEKNGETLEDGDIIVLSSKFIAMSEGRIVKIPDVVPSPEAEELASKLHLQTNLAELILREAEVVFGGVPGFALSVKYGVLTPNAGIDRSNVQAGWAILYPRTPFKTAEMLRRRILLETGKKVGIIITDSRLLPSRSGTSGIAIGVAGFDPIKDERGRRDLFDNVLRVTRRSLADDISAGAQLLMGEADEGIPIVIVRNTWIKLHDKIVDEDQMMIDYDECIYVRGLSNLNLIKRNNRT